MNYSTKSNFLKALIFVAGIVVAYPALYFFHSMYDKPCDLEWPTMSKGKEYQMSTNKKLLGYMGYTDSEQAQYRNLVARKALAYDSELVEFVRNVIDPPGISRVLKLSRPLAITPQAAEIDKLLQKQVKGFFVEAGALDGERSSNSIFFEMERNWTGLLVEPDPYFYTQLVGKNRACWSINACLSTSPFVTEMGFQESTGGHGKLVKDSPKKVPCFPLETILLAINVTTVDFFSLDVEGFELDVLKTLPQTGENLINIRSLAVEYLHGVEDNYKKYMASKGYNLITKLHLYKPEIALYVDDFIFVKSSTIQTI